MITCTDVIIVPLPPNVTISLHLSCVFSFSGTRSTSRPHGKRKIPCRVSDPVTTDRVPTPTQAPWGWHVELPMTDAYVHLGYKLVRMVQWIARHATPQRVLYLDKDMLDRQTSLSVHKMFASIPVDSESMVGDIMNCLTPANQVCCCENHFHAEQYNLSSPYARSPPIAWGGAGIGFSHRVLARLASQDFVHVLPYSDQTLSMWAHQVGVHLVQANWSFTAQRWCSGHTLRVIPFNETHWQCSPSKAAALRTLTTSSSSWCRQQYKTTG